MKQYPIVVLLYTMVSFVCIAQVDTTKTSNNTDTDIDINLETIANFSGGDNSPFWLTNNKFGLGSVKKNSEYLRLQTFAKKTFGNDINTTLGIDIVAAHNLKSDFHFQQLFGDLYYKKGKLSIGSKERLPLFKNELLSTGGMTLSNNARPIPQIEVSLPNFITIPYTKETLEFMGGISYGKLLDDKFKRNNSDDGFYAENILYHRKYGFLKFENNSVWNFIVGLEMDTQWGGHFYKDGQYAWSSPAGLKDFFKVLLPMSGGSDSNMTDQVNIQGNVYGSLHLMTNFRKESYTTKAYIERFFEDHSGLFFHSIPDGLYGIELKLNKKGWLTGVLFEYLHSKNQSAPFLWDKNETIPIQVSGGDNYYNHIDYISLTNYGFVMGNPLLTSPIYNDGKSLTVYNTRLSSFHGGLTGYLCDHLQYRALLTYSQSWGTPLIPSKNIRNQFSTMLEATYNNNHKLNGWLFSGALAYDKSNVIGDNIGVQLKVSKFFHID